MVGLAAILGLQSKDICIDPNIVDNSGEVKVQTETVYNVDVFNSHSEEKPKDPEV